MKTQKKINHHRKYKKFGENLKSVREFLGLTLKDLSIKSGLTEACISQVETGKREPKLSTIVKLLNALNVKFERLMGS